MTPMLPDLAARPSAEAWKKIGAVLARQVGDPLALAAQVTQLGHLLDGWPDELRVAAAAINSGPDRWFSAGSGTRKAAGEFIRLVRNLWVSSHVVPGLHPSCGWRAYGLQHIRLLSLSVTRADDAIATMEMLPALAGLDFSEAVAADENSALDVDSCGRILASSAATSISKLNLAFMKLGNERATQMVSTRCRMKLTELNLAANRLDGNATAAFLRWKPARTLQRLNLHNNAIDARTAAALRRLPVMKKLRYIDLSENMIEHDGLPEILPRGGLEVEILHLDRCGLDEFATPALSRPMPRLKHLYLAGNRISERALPALIEAPWARQLETLDLRDNEITDEGLALLGAPGAFPKLVTLLLDGNMFSPGALEKWRGRR